METPGIREQVDLIREVFAYTDRFKGSTFVIKISNAALDHPDFPQLARDLALLHRSGIRVILVPGARRRIDEVLDRFDAPMKFVGDIRVSPPDAIDLIKMAAFDVAHRVMTALSGYKVTAVIGNWVRARARGVVDGVDFERTGIVDRVRVEAVTRSMELGHVPLFPCIGHSESGDPYNLSSDELAKALAVVLDARKLFLVTAEEVLRTAEWSIPEDVTALEDGRIFRMALPAAEAFLKLNSGKSGLEPLATAVAACREGVERAHIIDGRVPGVLLKEIFSNLGVGTMIFGDAYERIRPMEPPDVPGAIVIMRPLIEAGLLVERSREDLEENREDYMVYAMDGVVHGCAALHRYDDGVGEIAGLAVDPAYVQLGIGAKLVGRLLEIAAEAGLSRVVALTVRAADWFITQGFRDGGVTDLPAAKRESYDAGRNSRVLVREVS